MALLTEKCTFLIIYFCAAKILKLINYKLNREIRRKCLGQLHRHKYTQSDAHTHTDFEDGKIENGNGRYL